MYDIFGDEVFQSFVHQLAGQGYLPQFGDEMSLFVVQHLKNSFLCLLLSLPVIGILGLVVEAYVTLAAVLFCFLSKISEQLA